MSELPQDLHTILVGLGKRSDKEDLRSTILLLCSHRPFKVSELAFLLEKTDSYLFRKFLSPLRKAGQLHYTQPDMPNHPQQAYTTHKTN